MLFVGVTQMYSNEKVYLCNVILVTKIFCCRHSTINNFASKCYFSVKFGDRFSNVLQIDCTNFFLDLFKLGISILRCLSCYFFNTL